MEPLHRVWMQVYFQVLSEISQMMNVLQILAWWMVKEEVADRLNSDLFFLNSSLLLNVAKISLFFGIGYLSQSATISGIY